MDQGQLRLAQPSRVADDEPICDSHVGAGWPLAERRQQIRWRGREHRQERGAITSRDRRHVRVEHGIDRTRWLGASHGRIALERWGGGSRLGRGRAFGSRVVARRRRQIPLASPFRGIGRGLAKRAAASRYARAAAGLFPVRDSERARCTV